MGPIASLLTEDHARLHALLGAARRGDGDAYARFRAGLLRHIGMEEKIVLRALSAAGAELGCLAAQLRLDHSAIAAMLVPTPTPALLARLAALLARHDGLEEGEKGFYAVADRVLAPEVEAILERLRDAKLPPLAKHFDGARAYAAIDELESRAVAGPPRERSEPPLPPTRRRAASSPPR